MAGSVPGWPGSSRTAATRWPSIDKQAKAFRRLPEGFSGRTIQGVGFDRDRLREAGIEEAGALAAVTSGDNSNIMVARTAREVFGLERVIARIYDPRRAAIYEKLGIPTIATVQWTTDRVLRRILPDVPGHRVDRSVRQRRARGATRGRRAGPGGAWPTSTSPAWRGWPPCPAWAWGRCRRPTSSPRRVTSST